jgi:DNA polymerase-3 subunit beta
VLDISDKSLTVSAQDLDFSNEATEQLACTYEGGPMKIAFNARFLAEMLGVLGSEDVRMEFSTPSRAGILTPVEESNNDRDILMLVMPVMLNG